MAADQHPEQLPRPDAVAQAHSQQLSGLIASQIDGAGGALRFSRYMELALYAPGLGYYSAGAAKFGDAGDFVTAPEISPLFARCVARNCAPVISSLAGPTEILELGAGSGVMAADLLLELDQFGALPARYLILEPSPDLRQRQRQTIAERVPALADRVRWLEQMPGGVRGVILANEVLDALPCERFQVSDNGIEYLGVARGDGCFVWQTLPADAALLDRQSLIATALGAEMAPGFRSEWHPALGAWVGAVADALDQGLLLLVDYGLPRRELYHMQRSDGTLLCHYRHRAHADPFFWPGLQDITAWVDFTAVAEAAQDHGLTLDGFVTQAAFLLGSGIDGMLSEPQRMSPRQRAEQARQVQWLTLPGEMGERFKVAGFSRGWDGQCPGLTGADLSGSL